jgi:hypothetical protein
MLMKISIFHARCCSRLPGLFRPPWRVVKKRLARTRHFICLSNASCKMPRDKVLFVSPGGEVFGSFLPAQKGTEETLKTPYQVQMTGLIIFLIKSVMPNWIWHLPACRSRVEAPWRAWRKKPPPLQAERFS